MRPIFMIWQHVVILIWLVVEASLIVDLIVIHIWKAFDDSWVWQMYVR